MPHLVIMAAGTGGHIIPGLAVAREVQKRGWTVSWLGTRTGMENRLVPPAQIPLDTISFSGLRGKGLVHTMTGGLRLLKAFWDCFGLLRRRGAEGVLGMGGYVCFPGGLMVQGIGVWFGGQALINLGVNLGALPTKGLTLPLMSYGGSAILMNLIALAIVVRVDIENRQLMRGGRA